MEYSLLPCIQRDVKGLSLSQHILDFMMTLEGTPWILGFRSSGSERLQSHVGKHIWQEIFLLTTIGIICLRIILR